MKTSTIWLTVLLLAEAPALAGPGGVGLPSPVGVGTSRKADRKSADKKKDKKKGSSASDQSGGNLGDTPGNATDNPTPGTTGLPNP